MFSVFEYCEKFAKNKDYDETMKRETMWNCRKFKKIVCTHWKMPFSRIVMNVYIKKNFKFLEKWKKSINRQN